MIDEETKSLMCASSFSKTIAKITLCGAFTIPINEGADFTPPTEEQRKNLKEMLCIDVEILE